MIAQDFLIKIIKQMPSRGLNNTEIFIHSIDENNDCISYKIVDIDNNGCNDAIYIRIKKEQEFC